MRVYINETEMESVVITMVVLTLGGGLGNQMFQYAYARYIQELHKERKIYINRAEVVKERDRDCSLGTLSVNEVVMMPDLIGKLFNGLQHTTRKVVNRIIKLIYKNDNQAYMHMNMLGFYYHDKVYGFYQSRKSLFPIKTIEGGFQSWRYLELIPGIRNELKVRSRLPEKNKKILDLIENSEAVCVHIRRGDYLLPKYSDLNVCDDRYYQKAIQYMRGHIANPVFFVFSNTADDLRWIEENYRIKGNVIYVSNDNPDFEELRLMYSCKHFIISNSTFSWWAQYLSERRELVVAPAQWNKSYRKVI